MLLDTKGQLTLYNKFIFSLGLNDPYSSSYFLVTLLFKILGSLFICMHKDILVKI